MIRSSAEPRREEKDQLLFLFRRKSLVYGFDLGTSQGAGREPRGVFWMEASAAGDFGHVSILVRRRGAQRTKVKEYDTVCAHYISS